MANHRRRQIREALVTALTGLTTTSTRVFPNRVYPFDSADLPGLLVTWAVDEPEAITMETPAALQSELTMVIEGRAQANADLDDVLDAIDKEVRTALYAAGTLSGLLARRAAVRRIEADYEDGLEKPVGVIRLEYQLTYFCREGAPDAAP